MKKVEIFTDGACRGNPGPGGWGALLRYNDNEKALSGAEVLTTNNRMELSAAIYALATLKQNCHVIVTTDSQYLKNGVMLWLAQWKRNGWRTKNKGAVKNQDLWEKLDCEIQCHQIEWRWVKGHSGHRENELADQLANQAIDQLLKQRELPHA